MPLIALLVVKIRMKEISDTGTAMKAYVFYEDCLYGNNRYEKDRLRNL